MDKQSSPKTSRDPRDRSKSPPKPPKTPKRAKTVTPPPKPKHKTPPRREASPPKRKKSATPPPRRKSVSPPKRPKTPIKPVTPPKMKTVTPPRRPKTPPLRVKTITPPKKPRSYSPPPKRMKSMTPPKKGHADTPLKRAVTDPPGKHEYQRRRSPEMGRKRHQTPYKERYRSPTPRSRHERHHSRTPGRQDYRSPKPKRDKSLNRYERRRSKTPIGRNITPLRKEETPIKQERAPTPSHKDYSVRTESISRKRRSLSIFQRSKSKSLLKEEKRKSMVQIDERKLPTQAEDQPNLDPNSLTEHQYENIEEISSPNFEKSNMPAEEVPSQEFPGSIDQIQPRSMTISSNNFDDLSKFEDHSGPIEPQQIIHQDPSVITPRDILAKEDHSRMERVITSPVKDHKPKKRFFRNLPARYFKRKNGIKRRRFYDERPSPQPTIEDPTRVQAPAKVCESHFVCSLKEIIRRLMAKFMKKFKTMGDINKIFFIDEDFLGPTIMDYTIELSFLLNEFIDQARDYYFDCVAYADHPGFPIID